MKLWKNNQRSNVWELPKEEIDRMFWNSEKAKGWKEWGGNLDYLVALFIGEDLSSVVTPEDQLEIQDAVLNTMHQKA